ncbi:MAG: hypothetical protein HRU15_15590 [Planctomycetes bacterium]|nr:hypothetical protein [Planctomycetota bacterium]
MNFYHTVIDPITKTVKLLPVEMPTEPFDLYRAERYLDHLTRAIEDAKIIQKKLDHFDDVTKLLNAKEDSASDNNSYG